ncbi:MAG: VCBS repeat-containing protein, partial [Bacteroidota bacterium]
MRLSLRLSPLFVILLFFSGISPLKAQEICNNGRDDDGDGLIDCFDEECSGMMGCEAFFYGQPEPDCGYTPPPLDEIEVTLLFETDEVRYPIDQRAGVFIGDMNGDGIADLVSRDNNPPRIQIFSGDDGRILQSIATPSTHPFGQTAIADVDADGLGDVFQIENNGALARYEFGNPNVVWRTGANIGDDNRVSTPQLADINQDGRPEVYVGDRIFDAITGIRIVDGGNNVNVGGYAGGDNSDRFPIYFDLFQPGDPRPDGTGNFGPEANGLEYIAGNEVWTVDFTANTANSGSFQLAAELDASNNEGDGLTSIADINGDGRMDVA